MLLGQQRQETDTCCLLIQSQTCSEPYCVLSTELHGGCKDDLVLGRAPDFSFKVLIGTSV